MKTETPNLKPAAEVWYVARNTNDTQGLIVSESTGANIAVTYRPEDAPIIVHCVNHHAALVEALEAVVNCDGYYYDLDGGSDITKEFEAVLNEARNILATVKPQ